MHSRSFILSDSKLIMNCTALASLHHSMVASDKPCLQGQASRGHVYNIGNKRLGPIRETPRLSGGALDQWQTPAGGERPPSERNTFATVVQRDINFWLVVAKGDIYCTSRRRCAALLCSCYGSRLLCGLEAKRYIETYLRLPLAFCIRLTKLFVTHRIFDMKLRHFVGWF